MIILCWMKHITKSEHYPWNGWVQNIRDYPVDDADIIIEFEGQKYYVERMSSFETGIYWLALRHLINCKTCQKLNQNIKPEKELKQIEELWDQVTGV